MTRSLLVSLAMTTLVGVAASPLFATGCKQSGVGDPCTPESEFNPEFNGFDQREVSAESKSFQCQTRLCLVNHFRGRVSCPYGQDKTGAAPTNAGPCRVPGSDTPITGDPRDTNKGAEVEPQCTDRSANRAVYCSCRCANIDGRTDDGANYCTCPDGFVCEQLIGSTGQGDTGLTGGYCIKEGTKFDLGNSCKTDCNPDTAKCDTL